MEEIRRVLEETAEDIDRKPEKIEPPEKEYVDGGSSDDAVLVVKRSDEDTVITTSSDEGMVVTSSTDEGMVISSSSNEDQGDDGKMEDGDDDETEEEDSSEEEWHEDSGPSLPYYSQKLHPRPRCVEGASYTLEGARKIADSADERNAKLFEDWVDLVDDNNDSNGTPHPSWPLPILPEITGSCAYGLVCYHRKYWTDITSETEPNHPYFQLCQMLQVFSLKLSGTLAHPLNIYGTFSLRDCWEPRRNFLFNRRRDDPATIVPDAYLPLCSPCRGIFVLQYLLIDIDLWIKEEGEMSADKPLFSGYVQLDAQLSGFDEKLNGRIPGDSYDLEMCYAFLSDSIETSIEVTGEAKYSQIVQISAFTGSFDDEVALYSGTFCGVGVMIRHFVAVRKLEKLHVVLKLDGSVHTWTLQAGVGVLAAPRGPIPGFDQLVMCVSYRTRDKVASAWKWKCVGNDVDVLVKYP